jgi:spore germination cell wall hydrolase CwlJ-like protein
MSKNPEHIIWKRVLKEAMDVPQEPPRIVFNMPAPAFSQSAVLSQNPGTFTTFQKERKRMTEAVVACLVLEAGGEGTEGMQAINEVIQNRARRLSTYPTDKLKALYDVVVKPKQFSCFNAGVDAAIAKAKKHSKWFEAIKILQTETTDLTHGARYYYANTGANKIKAPTWAKNIIKQGGKTVQIGNHIFLYNYKGN